MKKIVMLSMAILLILPLHVLADSLVLGSLEDLPPYQYMENGEWKGFDIEIGNEVSKRLGKEIKISGLPWARIQKGLEKGEIDGVISMFCMDKYLNVVDFTEPTNVSKVSVFAKKGSNIKVSSIEDLKGKKVGIIRGYTYDPEFSAYQGFERVVCDDDEMLIKMLSKDRFDVGVAEDKPFLFISKKLGLSNNFEEVYTITENNLCMAFSKKALGEEQSKALADQVNQILKDLKSEGIIEQIMVKYGK